MDNLTTLYYVGNVKVKLKIKDKIIELDNHNSGLPPLSEIFAKCITGSTVTFNDIPQYLDLYRDEISYLNKKPSLSGKYYDKIGNMSVAKFTAVIAYDNLRGAVGPGTYKFYLLSGNNTQLAWLPVDFNILSHLTPGTQAIIEWSMQLLVDAPSQP